MAGLRIAALRVALATQLYLAAISVLGRAMLGNQPPPDWGRPEDGSQSCSIGVIAFFGCVSNSRLGRFASLFFELLPQWWNGLPCILADSEVDGVPARPTDFYHATMDFRNG